MSTIDDQSLGRLQSVDLRTIWASEPAGFTPWLAEPENLVVLSETLGLDLELVTVDKEVGSFRADIVCRDIGTEDLVLIENQLEQTDHDHLGKLLTYAAGLQPGMQSVTVVWLADSFREEHRAVLDWLNEITDQDARFFGLEIELWQIGDSPAAPNFNIVSMPNDWSRSVAQATRPELSERALLRKEYWTGLHDRLNALGGAVHGNRTPGHRQWMAYSVGRSGFSIVAAINMREKYIRVEMYIKGDDAREYHDLLELEKDEIEQKLGYQLEWGDQLPTSRDRRISHYLHNTDPKDESDWPRQHEWLAKHLNKMHRAFEQQVRDL